MCGVETSGGPSRKSRRMSIGAVRVGALVANTLPCPRVLPRPALGVTALRPCAHTHSRTRPHFTPFHVGYDGLRICVARRSDIDGTERHSGVTHAATGGGRSGHRSRDSLPASSTFVAHAVLPAIQLPLCARDNARNKHAPTFVPAFRFSTNKEAPVV